MLKSSWSEGSARLFGARVIRQRLGVAPRRKSNAVHQFLVREKRVELCARLERESRR